MLLSGKTTSGNWKLETGNWNLGAAFHDPHLPGRWSMTLRGLAWAAGRSTLQHLLNLLLSSSHPHRSPSAATLAVVRLVGLDDGMTHECGNLLRSKTRGFGVGRKLVPP